jgi:hypothetical protein
MARKLPLNEVLVAIDYGARGVWDEWDETEKKEVNFWLLNRYASSLVGVSRDRIELAVFKTNEYYNKNWNVLGTRHPKLQWQLLCVSGNTGRVETHKWIGFKHKDGSNNKIVKFLRELYPNMKEDEVELLAAISTKAEIRKLATDLGYEGKDIPV